MLDHTPLRAGPALAAALALAVSAGCNYSFGNPAESLQAGEVAGRAVADSKGVAGASVSLRGSALDQPTRPNGRFGVLPLPAGRHTLVLRSGTSRAALREVVVGYGGDGQAEGVTLGSVALPAASALSGTVTSLGSASTQGVAVDGATGIAVSVSGASYRIDGLPIGSHRVVVATHEVLGPTWLAGPAEIEITEAEAGLDKVVAPLPLRSATSSTGSLLFRVSSTVSGLAAADAPVRVWDADGTPLTVPAPDSNGDRELTLAEGVYYVEVRAPASYTDVPAPARRTAIVLADELADLGAFTLADDATIAAARLSCHADADCAPGACTAGVCTGYTPPEAAPATAPLCADLSACWGPGGDCTVPGENVAGSCVANPADGTWGFCIPCGTACTPDGLATLSAAACP